MDVLSAFAAGALAGLALVVPLGAIGALLIQEGISRGLGGGAPAASAVAMIDFLYCLAAVTAGVLAAPVIAGWEPWPRIIGGVCLVVLAVHMLLSTLRTGRSRRPPAAEACSPESVRSPAPASAEQAGAVLVAAGGAASRFLLFAGLTAINPATLVYFTAIAAGLGDIVQEAVTGAAFAAGAAAASLSWQLLLVWVGAAIGLRAGPGIRRATGVGGAVLVAAFGVGMILTR